MKTFQSHFKIQSLSKEAKINTWQSLYWRTCYIKIKCRQAHNIRREKSDVINKPKHKTATSYLIFGLKAPIIFNFTFNAAVVCVNTIRINVILPTIFSSMMCQRQDICYYSKDIANTSNPLGLHSPRILEYIKTYGLQEQTQNRHFVQFAHS